MYRIPGVASAASTTPAAAAGVQPTRGPPPGGPRAPEDGNAAGPAESSPGLVEDRERIALGLNGIARQLFAARLDLQAALGLMGDQPASCKVCQAVNGLDQAIRDIRDTVFDDLAGDRPPSVATPEAQSDGGFSGLL
jgi:hypothetical protein